ncbi:MAG: gliding motility lipoprotein GldD [Bacteroidetes bacterium]|nr:gliding motility lipoprotein GldD [Bacteroidota bacterium]
MKRIAFYIVLIFSLTGLISCGGEDYTPKPKAFFRIDLPQKSYQTFDSCFPYSFEYPTYATIQFSNMTNDAKYWINLNFPAFNATIHFTYKPVKNDLDSLIDNTRRFVDKHIPKATSIKEKTYENPENNVYAVVYDIKGNAVASPYQFFATDKKKHYLRGALYFNMQPSNDSLAPVINFIEKDIDYLISKLKWK